MLLEIPLGGVLDIWWAASGSVAVVQIRKEIKPGSSGICRVLHIY